MPMTLAESIGSRLSAACARSVPGSAKRGSGFLAVTSCSISVKRVAAAGEELVGAAPGERQRDLLAGLVLQVAIGQHDRRLRRWRRAAGAAALSGAGRSRTGRGAPAGARVAEAWRCRSRRPCFSTAHRSAAELTCERTLSDTSTGGSALT